MYERNIVTWLVIITCLLIILAFKAAARRRRKSKVSQLGVEELRMMLRKEETTKG